MPIPLQIWNFLRVRKRFWLTPFIVVGGLFALLAALLKGAIVIPFLAVIL